MVLHSTISNTSTRKDIHVPGYTVADAAALAALTNMVAGDLAYRADVKEFYRYAAAWARMISGVMASYLDYSATATIVGWSSYTSKYIHVKKLGRIVAVNFYISGTSNSLSVNFTLPYQHENTIYGAWGGRIKAVDNGAAADTGYCYVISTPSVLHCFRARGGTWTNSGTKTVGGQVLYLIAN